MKQQETDTMEEEKMKKEQKDSSIIFNSWYSVIRDSCVF